MTTIRSLIAATAAASILAVGGAAWASCRISNETKWSFKVESGNVSNQSVGAHTTTSIAAGKIVGRSADGKTISGQCKDGDQLVIKEEKGVPILLHK